MFVCKLLKEKIGWSAEIVSVVIAIPYLYKEVKPIYTRDEMESVFCSADNS